MPDAAERPFRVLPRVTPENEHFWRGGGDGPMKASKVLEPNAIISGIGQSQIGRRIYRDPLGLTIEAVLEAIEDAGLTRDDIDGIATYPGNMDVPPGFSGGGVTELQDAL